MSKFVEQVFNDSYAFAELGIKEQFIRVDEQRRFYMAVTSALLQQMGGEAVIHDREFLLDAKIYVDDIGIGKHGIRLWVEGDKLVEEIDEDQLELPLEEKAV